MLQLVDEGKLALADPVSRYLPDLVPAERRITVRDLLDHRSGLVNVTDYGSWLEQAERSSSTRPRETVRFAVSHPPAFAAGSKWAYSNTNFLVLGLVVEAVTGRTYAGELSRRILEPLQLEYTELPTTRTLSDLDDEGTHPRLAWAAGGIVSDARDLARFFSALLSGELLSRRSLAAMKRTVASPIGGSGLGLFARRLPCGRFWGHGGAIIGYGTDVAASEDGRRVAVIGLRTGDSSPGGEPIAELLCQEDGA